MEINPRDHFSNRSLSVIFTSFSVIHSRSLFNFTLDSCSCHFASFAGAKIILSRHHHLALGRTRERERESERKKNRYCRRESIADSSSFIKKTKKKQKNRLRTKKMKKNQSETKRKKKQRPPAHHADGSELSYRAEIIYICEEQNSSRTNILT